MCAVAAGGALGGSLFGQRASRAGCAWNRRIRMLQLDTPGTHAYHHKRCHHVRESQHRGGGDARPGLVAAGAALVLAPPVEVPALAGSLRIEALGLSFAPTSRV